MLIPLLFVVLAACSPRADIRPSGDAPDAGEVVRVYVGTTRAREPDRVWSETDPAPLNYGYVDVGIPPTHVSGDVELSRGAPNPATDFVSRGVKTFASRSDFRSRMAENLSGLPRDERTVIVTIHGFNNTVGDSVFRTAQMIHDFAIDDLTVHYAWPSHGRPLGYAADRDAALIARDGLEQMLDDLIAAGASDITLLAHSMGSQVTMETLRQMARAGRRSAIDRIGAVVLMSPDLNLDVFRNQVESIGTLPQPFVIFTSRNDPALRLSARLTGQSERLGNIENIDDISDLDVIVIDLTQARDAASNHLAAASSPTIVKLLNRTEILRDTVARDPSGRLGLLPGTILMSQRATSLILSPLSALSEEAR